MKVNRLGVVTSITIATLLLFGCAFFAYDWLWGPAQSRKMLPILESELSLVPVPSDAYVIDTFSGYKSDHAFVARGFSTPRKWATLKDFYTVELERMGWKQFESRDVREWNKNYGGKSVRFRKGSFVLTLEYPSPPSNANWAYALDISIGLY